MYMFLFGKDKEDKLALALNKYGVTPETKINKEELKLVFKDDESATKVLENSSLVRRSEAISYKELRSELSSSKLNETATMELVEKCGRHLMLPLQGRTILLTWAEGIPKETIDKVVQTAAFSNWRDDMDKVQNSDPAKPDLIVEKVHIQNVDMFGPRVGFTKFQVVARKWNEKEKKIALVPGIVFMRGGAVGILCILKENKPDGKEYTLVTLQPRIPAACAEFCEIPAGMLDEARHKFAGKAADEMHEETGLEIREEDLIDLTQMAYGDRFRGMYPSAGGCDEFIRLFLYRRLMSPEVLQMLHNTCGGDDESEIIKIKLVPAEDLWLHAPDAKALSALYLYQKYLQKFPEKHPLPVDPEMERKLVAKLEAHK